MRLSPLLALSILFFAIADLWLAFPGIDLAVTGLFSTPGVGFPARGTAWEQLMYGSIDELLVIVGLGLIGAWAIERWRSPAGALPKDARELKGTIPSPQINEPSLSRGSGQRLAGRRLSFLLLLLALVPGLIVNQVLKEHWGRARPIQIEQFGGNRLFTPPFVISDQGGGSFSSGHVAAAAWLVAVAVVLSSAGSAWTLLTLVYLAAMVLARVAAGAHFLSDALTSILLVWMGYLVLQRLLGLDETAGARREPATA